MANTFDFNKLKKKTFSIILNDENNTHLKLVTPKKKIMSEFLEMSQNTANVSMDDIYNITAEIMSCNSEGKTITGAQLEEILDFEDILAFFQSYTAFIQSLSSAKN